MNEPPREFARITAVVATEDWTARSGPSELRFYSRGHIHWATIMADGHIIFEVPLTLPEALELLIRMFGR